MTEQQIAEMDIRLCRFDLAYHVGWKTPDGYWHTRRVETANEAIRIVEALVSGPWLTIKGVEHVTE